MSVEGKPEGRKLSLEEAQGKANMLASYLEGNERPTTKNYKDALNQLELLEQATNEGSVESMDKALRIFTAGTSVVVDRIPRLLVAAALNVFPYPENVKKGVRKALGGGVIEQLKNIPKDYEERRKLFQTAREELEEWQAQAEEFVSRQETAEEFNKRQAEQK